MSDSYNGIIWDFPWPEEVEHLSENPKEISFMERLEGMTYRESIEDRLSRSDPDSVGIAYVDGFPISLFGVIDDYTWTVHTPDIDNHNFFFIRNTIEIYNYWKSTRKVLKSMTLSDHPTMDRLFRKLGMELEGDEYIWKRESS